MIRLIKWIHSPVYRMRIKGMHDQILPWLNSGDRILDVGCGYGALGKMIMESPWCPADVKVMGLEKTSRDHIQIPIEYYSGNQIPYSNNSFDIIILADVLHHEIDQHKLIDECARISKRYIIIKDHKLDGAWAQYRISLMDWFSNIPYDIPCLYHYNRLLDWHRLYQQHRLHLIFEAHTVKLYPSILNFILGGRIQYFAVLQPDGR